MIDPSKKALTATSLAALASLRPWYADELKERSSMPPVSVTMQAERLPPPDAAAVVVAPAAVVVGAAVF